jgi:type II secretory ATPase GspE/PulE/Tfp pilus assembly ATPase PilB-like protein
MKIPHWLTSEARLGPAEPAQDDSVCTPPAVPEASLLPAPPVELARDVAYSAIRPQPFELIAQHLGLLGEDDVSRLRRRADQLHRRIDDVARELQLLDTTQVERIISEQAFVVHVNGACAGSAALLAWMETLHRQGIFPKVRRVSTGDLAKLGAVHGSHARLAEGELQALSDARRMLLDAAVLGASDVHLIILQSYAVVQVRVDGELKTARGISLHPEQGERFVRAITTGLATVTDTYNPLAFQDAQIAGEMLPGSGLTSIRVIRGPGYPAETGGGFLVARLQYDRRAPAVDPERRQDAQRRLDLVEPTQPEGEFQLAGMGYTPRQVELVDRLMRRPMGIAFIVGPTGSGKTTTLDEVTMELARLFPGTRLITIENPVEYPKEWAVQLSTTSDRFGEMLRMTLRMDPDTIMPGEIRGIDEARAALAGADTGHLILATLHVNDPFQTFTRLSTLDRNDLTLEELCDHNRVIGLISQRLVQVLCPDHGCSESFEEALECDRALVPAFMLEALRSWGDLSKVRVKGMGRPECPHCKGKGILGRRAVAEVVVTDEALMHDVLEFGVIEAARRFRARPDADRPMIAHAMDLVLGGQLDPREAARQVGEIPHKEHTT